MFNSPSTLDKRRNLRNNQTDAEQMLWQHLRKRQVLNLKFLRQYGVADFILDFYCPQVCLAIELDGGQHDEPVQKQYDIRRTLVLEGKNITIVRYWNSDIFLNLEGVMKDIYKKCFSLLKDNPS